MPKVVFRPKRRIMAAKPMVLCYENTVHFVLVELELIRCYLIGFATKKNLVSPTKNPTQC